MLEDKSAAMTVGDDDVVAGVMKALERVGQVSATAGLIDCLSDAEWRAVDADWNITVGCNPLDESEDSIDSIDAPQQAA